MQYLTYCHLHVVCNKCVQCIDICICAYICIYKKYQFEGLNTNYYGMLDQLIASKGRTFIGTYYSTFTGYINRMRGYASTKFELEGFDKGIIDSYYFTPKGKKEDMRKYKAIRGPYFSREFPTAWYNLEADRNIE